MSDSFSRWTRVVILQFTAAFSVPLVATAAADDLIKQIVTQWETRQQRVSAVRYSAVGLATSPSGSRNTSNTPPGVQHPPVDLSYEVRRDWIIDFANGSIRRQSQNQAYRHRDQKLYPRFDVLLFDGVSTKLYRPRSENVAAKPGSFWVDLVLNEELPNQSALFAADDLPVYFAHGIVFYGQDLRNGLRHPINGGAFYVFDELAQASPSGGRTVVLRTRQAPGDTTERVDEFTVDVSHSSAITKWTMYGNGGRLLSSINIDYASTQDGPLPKHWQLTMYRGASVGYSVVYDIVDYEIDPPTKAADFSMKTKPGMVVNERGKLFKVGEDGVSRVRVSPQDVLVSKQTFDWWWAAIGCAALLIGFIVVVRLRQRLAR